VIGAALALAFFLPAFPPQARAESPIGADIVPDLYSPVFAGSGAFSTSLGGAPASAINPAAGGEAQRIVFDAGYLGMTTFGGEFNWGNVVELGLLVPSKFAVFGGSLHLIHSPFSAFPVKTNFDGNLNIAKELYPGLDLGLGFNFGFGEGEGNWSASGDLGFRYNLGKLSRLENFTLAFVMKSMGKSWTPTAFTPTLGLSTDFIHLRGNGDTADPLKVTGFLDFGVPGFQNFTGKIGAAVVLAEVATISGAWGFNVKDMQNNIAPFLPSLGVSLNFVLRSGGKGIIGGRLPSDGDLSVAMALKPMYSGITGIGAGLTWFVGVTDKTPPSIAVDYPETLWISPNNDGIADALEFPIRIYDQRYVTEWVFEIKNDSGEAVRTYRNKEIRPETQGVRNVFIRLVMVKSGVEIPPSLRWDGTSDSGETAPDGRYFFTVSAADDNGNTITTQSFEVVVDNTAPEIEIAELPESARIFSPDGDGNKDTIEIGQSGSREDLWEGGVYDAEGNRVKTFTLSDTEPELLAWDGTDDGGLIVADGVYGYRITATDRAGNTGSAALDNIIISTIQPAVSLAIGDAYFSPNGDGIKDTVALIPGVPVREGIVGWDISVRNAQADVERTITGGNAGGAPPARIDFDGKNNGGTVLVEGIYNGALSVRYRNGYVSTAYSPSFTLDLSPPSASVRAGYTAFSPNNDGNQDEMIITQEGSSEVAWQGTVRRVNAPPSEQPVRTFRFAGVPPSPIAWDGLTDTGAIAPDGEYGYELISTDQAGNTGRSNTVRFSLSTADTPVLLSTDLRDFSPNGDGSRDTVSIVPQIQLNQGISSWKLDILDSTGSLVRTFEGQNAVPPSIPWNGRTAANAIAPDGAYQARMELRYAMGNQPVATSRPFVLDTVAPKAELSVPFTLFSPNGDGLKDFIPINLVTEGNDEWLAEITDSRGTAVQSWNWTGSAPNLTWDGTDSAGNNVPDGTYRLTLSSTDEGGNSFRKTVDNLTVDARIPRIFLTSSSSGIAPKRDAAAGIRLGTVVSLKEGIESWKLELQDDTGRVFRRFPGEDDRTPAPPEAITWNGMDAAGVVREGIYTPVMTVTYTKGDVVTAQAAPIIVDITGPELSFSSLPEFFSPDNDGVDDELIMSLGVRDASPIGNWSLEIREVRPDSQGRATGYGPFYRIEGRGSPAERLVWDGRSNGAKGADGTEGSRGELVQAATDYPFVLKAADILGNESTLEGKIGVDVLVIRDGDLLRIQVPSIVFRANEADFIGLPQEVVDNNNRILRRIAEILNKFRDYKIQVEGHANPVLRTAAEETNELQPLSERRARATVDFLVGFGVNRGRLSATGRGGQRPVVRYEDRDNWWKNRRVEFILIK
jgi:flagellar hook assembly protein FlgD/flagellar motor protein MotB